MFAFGLGRGLTRYWASRYANLLDRTAEARLAGEHPNLARGLWGTQGGLLDAGIASEIYDRFKENKVKTASTSWASAWHKFLNAKKPDMKRKAGKQKGPAWKRIKGKRPNKRKPNRPNIISRYAPTSSSGGNKVSKKYKKLVRFARRLDKAEDVAAPRCITIKVANATCAASAGQCKMVFFHALTRLGGTNENQNDLGLVIGHAMNIQDADASVFKSKDDHHEIFLRNVSLNFNIRESATANARVEIFELIAKKNSDVFMAGENDMSNALTNVSNHVSTRSHTGASAITNTHPAFDPYMWHALLQTYKVYKKHNIYLESSQSVYWNKSFNINKFIDPAKVLKHDKVLKGITRMFVFKVTGDLDTTTGAHSAAEIKIELNAVYTYSTSEQQDRLITVGGTSAPS